MSNVWKIFYIYLILLESSLAKQCPLNRSKIETIQPKTLGDGGFKIVIRKVSEPIPSLLEEYIPNEVYIIEITSADNKVFEDFRLSVNSDDDNPKSEVGHFVIYPFENEKQYHPKCSNIIIKAGSKTYNVVKAIWKAPPSKSGCIVFSALVLINETSWYADDEKLEKIFCEKKK